MQYSRRPGWRTQTALLLIVVSLVALVVVDLRLQDRIGVWRTEVADVAAPARTLLTQIQLNLALETANTRAFALTGNERYGAGGREAREGRLRAFAELLPLARRLGTPLYSEIIRLDEQIRPADAVLDSLFTGRISRAQYIERLPDQQIRLEQVIATAARIDRKLSIEVAASRENTRVAIKRGVILTVALALLALIAAALVARLSQRYRLLAEDLNIRLQQQTILRGVASRLGIAVTVQDVVQTIAEQVVASTEAFGAYVERIDVEPGTEVEVVAVAGKGTPPLGTRIPYPGSLTEEIIESGEPHIMTEVGAIGERMAPYLKSSCRGCTGLIVPLSSGPAVLGALVLLRGSEQRPFSRDEAAFVRILGDLNSAALRRSLLTEQLQESEARFHQIADHLEDVIWLGAPDLSKRYYVNRAYERIWGRSVESFYRYPRSPVDAVHPADRARVEAILPKLLSEEYEAEYRIIRPDGEIRWIWSRAYPIRNEHGEVYRIAGIMEDITERKKAERERELLLQREREAAAERERLLAREQQARAEANQKREELERVTESRAVLVRGFSHDVKNPLGAADGFLQLLEEGVMDPLTDKQKDSVVRIRRSIKSALGLIRDLLAISQAEAGAIELEIRLVDLKRIIREEAEAYRAQIESNGLRLEVELPETLPLIHSDGRRIRQIVGNLLSNAVKFTQQGSITIKAQLREGEDAPGSGRWVAIGVCDTGIGISPEQQKLLFKEFQRLENVSGERGAGIGLAISRQIARALGGDITVTSEVDKGTTFTLWLPLRESDS